MPPFRRARPWRGTQVGWIILWAFAGALAFNACWLILSHWSVTYDGVAGEGRSR